LWIGPAHSLPRGWKKTTRTLHLGIRPEAISVRQVAAAPDVPSSMATLCARVTRLEFSGPDLLATLAVGPHRVIARLPTNQALEDRQRVELVLDLSKALWFDQTTGEALIGGA
jgi:ABC-type sugar transport system ATPase subunit